MNWRRRSHQHLLLLLSLCLSIAILLLWKWHGTGGDQPTCWWTIIKSRDQIKELSGLVQSVGGLTLVVVEDGDLEREVKRLAGVERVFHSGLSISEQFASLLLEYPQAIYVDPNYQIINKNQLEARLKREGQIQDKNSIIGYTRTAFARLVLPQLRRPQQQQQRLKESYRVLWEGEVKSKCPAIWLHCTSITCYQHVVTELAKQMDPPARASCLVAYLSGLSLFTVKDFKPQVDLPKWLTVKLHWSVRATRVAGEKAKEQAELDGCTNMWMILNPMVELTEGWSDRVAGIAVTNTMAVRWAIYIWLERFECVRDLIGSIHDWIGETGLSVEQQPSIIVGYNNATMAQQEVIGLWAGVELHELHSNATVEQHWLQMMEDHLSHADLHVAIHESVALSLDTLPRIQAQLHRETCIQIKDSDLVLLEGYTQEGWLSRNRHRMACLRGWSKWGSCPEPPFSLPSLTNVNATNDLHGLHYTVPIWRPNERGEQEEVKPAEQKHFCNLMIREEAVTEPLFIADNVRWLLGDATEGSKRKVAILIPTKNGAQDQPASIALLQVCIRTMLASITEQEWSKFQLVLYLGYDHLDPILDQAEPLQQFETELRRLIGSRDVRVKLHRLPASKWATFLWNSLFADAIRDNNDYFYAINDDITFMPDKPEDSGWLSWMTEQLDSQDGVGVVGPNDLMWSCRLLTQSMVTKKHWEIFGTYYPLAIKDWFSDNWIGDVYPSTHRHCDPRWTIRNSAVATRYTACDRPKWQRPLEEGRQRVLDYLKK